MDELGGLLGFFVVFALASGLVLHLADADADRESSGARSGIAVWLLAFFHANTVVAAASTDAGKVSALETPLLVAGIVLAVAGWVLFIWSTLVLVRRGGFAGLETTQLVTGGPFRFSRHPQSLGWTLLLLGLAIASRSVVALVLVGAFAVFATRYARIEERQLGDRFGEAFERYRRRTAAAFGRS